MQVEEDIRMKKSYFVVDEEEILFSGPDSEDYKPAV
jgi:hypothetical protein